MDSGQLKEPSIKLEGHFVCPHLLKFHPAAPCMAENLAASLDCYNSSAEVSWSSVKGAESYLVNAVGENGHRVSCGTNENQCDLMALQCGQVYNVSLTAVNAHCQRQAQTNVSFGTSEYEWDCCFYIFLKNLFFKISHCIYQFLWLNTVLY